MLQWTDRSTLDLGAVTRTCSKIALLISNDDPCPPPPPPLPALYLSQDIGATLPSIAAFPIPLINISCIIHRFISPALKLLRCCSNCRRVAAAAAGIDVLERATLRWLTCGPPHPPFF